MAIDLLIKNNVNPQALDRTLNALGAALVMSSYDPSGYQMREGCYVMRVLDDKSLGFVKFACQHQGYCMIVKQLESLV